MPLNRTTSLYRPLLYKSQAMFENQHDVICLLNSRFDNTLLLLLTGLYLTWIASNSRNNLSSALSTVVL